MEELDAERQRRIEGHAELATLIASLKQMLNMNRAMLSEQTEQIRSGHNEMHDNLQELHEYAMDQSQTVNNHLDELVSRTENVLDKFDATIGQLDELHRTMLSVAGIVRDVQQLVDTKLEWLVRSVGGTGMDAVCGCLGRIVLISVNFTENFLRTINVVLQHLGFMLLGMLILVFCDANRFMRIVLVLTAPVNMAATLLTEHYCLDIIILAGTVIAIFIGNNFVISMG